MQKDYINGAYGALPDEFAAYATARIAILPIPYDGTSTWQKGADQGPAALLAASANMELYDLETNSEVFRQGIVTMPPVACPAQPEQMIAAVTDFTTSILTDQKFVVGLGGEHSITIGLVKAMHQFYPHLSVLQLDAHSDLRPEYEHSPYNHACVMARVREICPIVQVGIRSMDSSELPYFDSERVVFAHEFPINQQQLAKILKHLTDQVYVTIDLDVFDPAYMPSTGTPEPGGLDWYTVMHILNVLVKNKKVVGFDVNELLPNPQNKAPDFLAAKLVYRFLSMIFEQEVNHAKE
jgi:agmatinase